MDRSRRWLELFRTALPNAYPEGSDAALARLGYRCASAAALRVQGRIWGALIVASAMPAAFTDEHRQQLQHFAELFELAVSRIEDRQRLADEAARDSLTGLLNHRAFQERLAEKCGARTATTGRSRSR